MNLTIYSLPIRYGMRRLLDKLYSILCNLNERIQVVKLRVIVIK